MSKVELFVYILSHNLIPCFHFSVSTTSSSSISTSSRYLEFMFKLKRIRHRFNCGNIFKICNDKLPFLAFQHINFVNFLVVCRHRVLHQLRQVSQHRQGRKEHDGFTWDLYVNWKQSIVSFITRQRTRWIICCNLMLLPFANDP